MAGLSPSFASRMFVMRAIPTVAFALVLAGAAAPALAQSLVVPIDHSVRIGVKGQAASVVVGNPQVADVTVVDTHTLFVSGRGYGETDVVVLDGAGRTIYAGDVVVAAAASGGAAPANPLAALASGVGGMTAGGAKTASAGASTMSPS